MNPEELKGGIRKLYFRDKWVILAPERSKRPKQFRESLETTSKRDIDSNCPFCPGNENKTPEDLLKKSKDGEWYIRVFRNKYPALKPLESLDKRGKFVEELNRLGYHEVIVENRKHNKELSDMEVDWIEEIIKTFIQRRDFFENKREIEWISIFKNKGEEAGASLAHPHSQLVALPLIPPDIKRERREAQEEYREKGKCPYCEIVKFEAENKRLVFENEGSISFCSYAPRWPYETWILPKEHSTLSEISGEGIRFLAENIKVTLQKLNNLLASPPYNLIFFLPPLRTESKPYDHLRIEIHPRLVDHAGFELNSGVIITTKSPEEAAKELKKEKVFDSKP